MTKFNYIHRVVVLEKSGVEEVCSFSSKNQAKDFIKNIENDPQVVSSKYLGQEK